MQSYPETLKAISIHAPHAYAICMGIKKAEYRSQPTERRGWILIHASQSKDSDYCLADYGIPKDAIKRGAIIGAAYITGCTWDAGFECYAYHLKSPILFKQPIEGIKGCQAIFWGAKTSDKQAAFAQAWKIIAPPQPPTTPTPAANPIPQSSIPDSEPPAADFIPRLPITPPPAADSISQSPIPNPQSPIPNPQPPIIPGYRLESQDGETYQVFDSLTEEPLWQISSHHEGWMNGLTKKAHSSPLEAILEAREKAIGRIERSIPLEISQIDCDTFVVRNPENGNHYAVRPHHPDPHEKCECGDAHFRGVRCKHQIAVDQYIEQQIAAAVAQAEFNRHIEQQAQEIAPNHIQFTSPDDFYTWEAIADGKTIATINYDSENLTQPWVVSVGVEIHRTNTQAKAESYIRWHYKQGTLPVFEEEQASCTIEDCKYFDDKGQQHTFRINGELIGYIWLADDGGDWYSSQEYWVNGDGTKYDDWRECGLKLAQLTRHDLYEAAVA